MQIAAAERWISWPWFGSGWQGWAWKEILAAQARTEGKPDNIIEKMIIGRINKFYKEVALLIQEYIKDEDLTVTKYVQRTAKELGSSIKIDYTRFEKARGLKEGRRISAMNCINDK